MIANVPASAAAVRSQSERAGASPVRALHWALLAASALLLGAWEALFHVWFMGAAMPIRHGANVAGTVAILALVVGSVFSVIDRYARALRETNAALAASNDALRQLEAVRDERLVALARDMGAALTDLSMQARFAVQSATDLAQVKSLSAAIDRAEALSAVAGELLALSRMLPETAAGGDDPARAAGKE